MQVLRALPKIIANGALPEPKIFGACQHVPSPSETQVPFIHLAVGWTEMGVQVLRALPKIIADSALPEPKIFEPVSIFLASQKFWFPLCYLVECKH